MQASHLVRRGAGAEEKEGERQREFGQERLEERELREERARTSEWRFRAAGIPAGIPAAVK